MKLKEVAAAARLSVGFISQIERDIAVPSISSLVSVSNALKANVCQFLTQPVGRESTHSGTREVYSVGTAKLTYERISASFPGCSLRSTIINKPPGHKAELNSHEGEELIFVLEGKIIVEVDGETSILSTGDSIHFLSRHTHRIWNHTDRLARMLWVGTMDIFGEGDTQPDPIHKNNGDNVQMPVQCAR